MSVSSEITRITNNRNTICNKLVDLGLAHSESACAGAVLLIG